MRQGLEALRVPSKAAILSHLNNMGLSAILAHKAATGLEGGAHNIAQASALEPTVMSLDISAHCVQLIGMAEDLHHQGFA